MVVRSCLHWRLIRSRRRIVTVRVSLRTENRAYRDALVTLDGHPCDAHLRGTTGLYRHQVRHVMAGLQRRAQIHGNVGGQHFDPAITAEICAFDTAEAALIDDRH